jgi:hypothetical protein
MLPACHEPFPVEQPGHQQADLRRARRPHRDAGHRGSPSRFPGPIAVSCAPSLQRIRRRAQPLSVCSIYYRTNLDIQIRWLPAVPRTGQASAFARGRYLDDHDRDVVAGLTVLAGQSSGDHGVRHRLSRQPGARAEYLGDA